MELRAKQKEQQLQALEDDGEAADDRGGVTGEIEQDFEEDDDYDYGENEEEAENMQVQMEEARKKKDRCEDEILFNV